MEIYQGIDNPFRRKLHDLHRLYGCWASLANPISTEIIGYVGFDWILLDGEHSPNDLSTLHMQLLALKDSTAAPVVRPQTNDPVLFKRLLDLGFYNFLVPMVNTAEQARQAVVATRYPPEGIHGVSLSQRSNHYGGISAYFDRINSSICIMVQIESPAAVENIEQIVAVEGVDGVFIGPQDLAATYGHLLNPGHDDVQAAIRHVVSCCKRAGRPVGTLAPDEAQARGYMDMGMTFIAVAVDQGLLKASAKRVLDAFRRV